MNTVIALVLFFGAEPIARLMSQDPAVVLFTVQYLKIVGLSQPLVAIWLILMGALNGSGYTKWPMIATFIVLTIFRIPLAWYLTVDQNMGPMGTWISIAASSTIIGLLFIWRFKTGVWKLQKV